jgi:CelD/BcsL family acetyltransferase involved in cellulose biosynthesis
MILKANLPSRLLQVLVDTVSHGELVVRASRGDVQLLEQHAAQWLALCKESASDAPFFHPEWVCAYVRAFEPQRTVLLATAHRAGRLQAVLPLIEKHTFFCGLPVRMLSGAANAHSCRFDLVRTARKEGDLAVQSIWTLLKNRPDWDLIELPYVPQGGAAEDLLRLARQDGFLTGKYESYCSPYIPLGSGARADLIAPDAHFRQNLRRRMRKARARWDVRLRRIAHPDRTDLERFYRLESSGWKGKSKTAIACSESTRQFYDEIASVGSQLGYFSLYLLEFGDTVVAGHFGLSYQGRYHSSKVAYAETYAAYGPGHLIVEAILSDILPQGFHEFDFLGPSMNWKAEWARQGRTHSFCYVFRPGLFGYALHTAQLKVRPTLRRVVRGRQNSSDRDKSSAHID